MFCKLTIPILPQNTIHNSTTCDDTCLTKLAKTRESKSMWACTCTSEGKVKGSQNTSENKRTSTKGKVVPVHTILA